MVTTQGEKTKIGITFLNKTGSLTIWIFSWRAWKEYRNNQSSRDFFIFLKVISNFNPVKIKSFNSAFLLNLNMQSVFFYWFMFIQNDILKFQSTLFNKRYFHIFQQLEDKVNIIYYKNISKLFYISYWIMNFTINQCLF